MNRRDEGGLCCCAGFCSGSQCSSRPQQLLSSGSPSTCSSGGYSGGSNPESISALAFPLSFLVVIFVGLPAALICGLAWAVYFAVARRSRR